MKKMKWRRLAALCGVFYLLAAALPLLSFCSVQENEGKPETGSSAIAGEPAGKGDSPSSSASGTPVEAGGVFRLKDADGSILEVSDSEFVKGGIAAEIPPSYEPEALKAQGIALYTYYSRLREQNREKGGEEADFSCNTKTGLVYVPQETRKKRWGESYEKWEAALEEAEKAIRGKTLQQDGELICSTYFAISSGNTDAGEDVWGGDTSYLSPAASPGDIYADGYLSSVSMSVEEARAATLKAFPDAKLGDEPEEWLTEIVRTGSGTVKSGKAGGVKATGTELRNAFGLRSANFTWKIGKDGFTFTVKGWGHNVGMSQVGAQYMAQNGASCQEILSWYYPGSKLV